MPPGRAGRGSPANSSWRRTAAQRVLRLKAARRSRMKKFPPIDPMAAIVFGIAIAINFGI